MGYEAIDMPTTNVASNQREAPLSSLSPDILCHYSDRLSQLTRPELALPGCWGNGPTGCIVSRWHDLHPADALLAPGEPGLARGSVLHRRAEERSRLDE